jgi:hypothetical protein
MDHSPLPWRLESRDLGAGKALLVLAANGDLVASSSHTGLPVSYLTEEGRRIIRTPEQTEGNCALLVRAVNASKTLVDVCADVASQLRFRSKSLQQAGRAEAEAIADLACALEEALRRVVGAAADPAAGPPARPWLDVQALPENPPVIVDVASLPVDAPAQDHGAQKL